ncbi:DNA-directed DNA polymerase epsilon, subunit C [Maudiozyma exigua]|uniref:DNA-directed DNA polymerase epsilon, subunit C n=1 Tax=Maudiozyma exigua TaxID=34358 RepID=A0A9P6WA68_MAUEX|nr:DNA-directed DNA polymerase epsilon, subunit C [Kazachstania exigua]
MNTDTIDNQSLKTDTLDTMTPNEISNHTHATNDQTIPNSEELAQYMPALPIDKIQMISKTDPAYMDVTDDGYAATAFATEFFIKTLTHDTLKLSELKLSNPGTNLELNYNDIADLVSIQKPYMFLRESIPRTKSLADLVRENKVRYTTVVPEGQMQAHPIVEQEQEQPPQLQLQQPLQASSEVIEIASSENES